MPRAVVIPFGVPDDGIGLGLGLAALVHSFARIGGESVALAQLLATKNDDENHEDVPSAREPRPVEAFIPPHAWRDLTGEGHPPVGVSYVLTGLFEPPTEGQGLIRLLAFEARNGRTRAKVEARVDGEHAGRSLLHALDELCAQLGGELGTVRGIGDLSWEALESVLRAERCALHDPVRGGPHDRLAAMMHLGRAIGDAPDARFPASRLAALALDAAPEASRDEKLTEAVRRALTRAMHDAPSNVDLVEAVAAFAMRAGEIAEAERRVQEALTLEPTRARLYALLSEARRARGDSDGALAAIEDGLLHDALDPLLNTERGLVLAERSQWIEAEAAWRMVLDGYPLYLPAFTNLASLLMDRKDEGAATCLVDDVLSRVSETIHPDVLRCAIHVILAAESEGLARAVRVTKLAEALVSRTPNDAWASLVLARALAASGHSSAAIRRLRALEATSPTSRIAAEAQHVRFALEEPQASLEIDAVLRAVHDAPLADLEIVAVRARNLARTHAVWRAHFAVGVAEKRLEHWRSARDAFVSAVAVAPGASPAHAELSAVYVALEESRLAIEHARTACGLEGPTARTLAVLATALLAAGDREEALATIEKALALDATDEANRALAQRIREKRPARANPLTRLRGIVDGLRKT